MKKWMGSFLAASMVMSMLTGCGAGTEQTDSAEETKTEAAQAEETEAGSRH